MGIRSAGFALPIYTTAELAAFVASYGPAGTTEVNGLQPGQLVWDSTALVVKVYDGTAFVAA